MDKEISQFKAILNNQTNSIYVADESIDAVLERFKNYLRDKDIKKKLPEYIRMCSIKDMKLICEVGMTRS